MHYFFRLIVGHITVTLRNYKGKMDAFTTTTKLVNVPTKKYQEQNYTLIKFEMLSIEQTMN